MLDHLIISLDPEGDASLQAQLRQSVVEAILSRAILPGDKLPASRALLLIELQVGSQLMRSGAKRGEMHHLTLPIFSRTGQTCARANGEKFGSRHLLQFDDTPPERRRSAGRGRIRNRGPGA